MGSLFDLEGFFYKNKHILSEIGVLLSEVTEEGFVINISAAHDDH